MNKSEILAATTWRRAIKKYNGQQIPDEDWQFLLEVARLAPSSMGLEPWHILEINDSDLRQKIADVSWGVKEKMPDVAKFIVFTVTKDLSPESAYFREIRDMHGYSAELQESMIQLHRDFGIRDADLSDARKSHDWAAKQAYIAFAQMIFAAAEIGVDSTPVEGYSKQALERVLTEAGALDLEKDSVALCAAFGYRDGEVKHPKSRRPLDKIIKVI
ncbi:MAG: NAD(P)H-dependent oxidoreductase [Streptococcaceae bacterium]|nr:NAD(P)H-dependent oxidoreductase [Streptococcaceae bacterium]